MKPPKTWLGHLMHAIGVRTPIMQAIESVKSKRGIIAKAKEIILILERLKQAVEVVDTGADTLTKIIPGHWDDAAVSALRFLFARVLKTVGIARFTDPAAATNSAIVNLAVKHPSERNKEYKDIASTMLRDWCDLDHSAAEDIIERQYQAYKTGSMQNDRVFTAVFFIMVVISSILGCNPSFV